jgi:hypothetical protein
MLSSLGIRAYSLFIESFFSAGIQYSIFSFTPGRGSDTYWRALVSRLACVACAMCVAALNLNM